MMQNFHLQPFHLTLYSNIGMIFNLITYFGLHLDVIILGIHLKVNNIIELPCLCSDI